MADLKQGLFHTSRPAASISHLPDVRDEALDALRGIAALVVVLCHLFLAFAPAYTGLLSHTDPTLSWIGKPWYGLINGTAAVIFFFVLSGFVLSRKHLGTRTGGPVIAGMLKRWPRLAGPVVISCVFAWVIYALDGYRNAEAATAAGSSWLATIAPTGPTGQSPTFWGAIAQGAFGTFFQGTTSYNQVLWSMRWELYGSFVAFALALALMHAHESRPRALLILGSTISLGALSPGLAAFPIGVGLALLSVERRVPALSTAGAIGLVVFALLAFSYLEQTLLGRKSACWLGSPIPMAYFACAGAAALILAVEGHPPLRTALTGICARWLGRLSFPVYLLHMPILASAGSYTFMSLGADVAAAIAASAVTLALTAFASWPLAVLDEWWARRVSQAIRAGLA